MNPVFKSEEYLSQAQELLTSGKDLNQISELLAAAGADGVTIETITRQLKSAVYLKRRKRGIQLGVA